MPNFLFPYRLALAAVAVLLVAVPARAERPMHIVGSTFLEPYVESVVAKLVAEGAIPVPTAAHGGTGPGVASFCSASGNDGPDVVAMSRRMRQVEFDLCKENDVDKIIEIQLGVSALALVGLKNGPNFDLALRDLYLAVAAELPVDSEFVRNTLTTWKAIDPHHPDLPLHVLVPGPGLGSRGFFEDRFLEAACRKIPQIKAIFSASERAKQCVTLRRDGRVGEIGLPYARNLRNAIEKARPGTVAVVPLTFAEEMLDLVKILPLDGELPTPAAIASRNYDFIRPLFIDVNRDRVKSFAGVGPVVGLREFITELTREETIGSGGYLEKEGLVPLRAEQRRAVRDAALGLRIVQR